MTDRAFDDRIDRLARSQRGTFSRAQARHVGATSDLIDTRVGNRRWLVVDNAVYALPSHPATWEQRVLAATLGERTAVASGRSAASLFDWPGYHHGRPEITVPANAHHESRIARIRRSDLVEARTHQGIRTNSAALTLFELAGRFPLRHDHVVEAALRQRQTTMDELTRWYERLERSRRPGVRLMGALLDKRGGDYVPAESGLEERLYELLDVPEFQPFLRQAPAPWNPDERVDALMPDGKVIVEADGPVWHEQHLAVRNDKRRDRRAAAHGWECLRYDAIDLTETPKAVRAEVRAVLAERRRAA